MGDKSSLHARRRSQRGSTLLFSWRDARTSTHPGARPIDACKRLIDVALVLPLLVVMTPVWLVVAMLVKLETPGPVFFRQTRVGRGGRLFTMVKFRSMVQNAEALRAQLESYNEVEGGILFKLRNDPRVTRLGQLLRRTSLDETPQFLNVLLGHMSLVGPRPPLPSEVELYNDQQLRRLEVRPGITGIWQVSGRSTVPFDEQVRMDIEYIDNRSLGLDLRILARTVPAILVARGAF